MIDKTHTNPKNQIFLVQHTEFSECLSHVVQLGFGKTIFFQGGRGQVVAQSCDLGHTLPIRIFYLLEHTFYSWILSFWGRILDIWTAKQGHPVKDLLKYILFSFWQLWKIFYGSLIHPTNQHKRNTFCSMSPYNLLLERFILKSTILPSYHKEAQFSLI